MAKPKAERPTNNPIGQRINHVLSKMDKVGDYAYMAAYFGVKVPSVYGWVDTGRIHKSRLSTLVDWSGYPHSWWLDNGPISEPSGPTIGLKPANSAPGVYQISTRSPTDVDSDKPMPTLAQAVEVLSLHINAIALSEREAAKALLSALVATPAIHPTVTEGLERLCNAANNTPNAAAA